MRCIVKCIVRFCPAVAIALVTLTSCFGNIAIEFDYTHNTHATFFGSGSSERACLDQAASFFEGIITDDLDAINPVGAWNETTPVPSSWRASFSDPSSTAVNPGSINEDFLSITADTLKIFVGAANLPGSTLGRAGPGGRQTFGTAAWNSTVLSRGESGATQGASATEFAPWGGSLSMDSDVSWDFGNTGACEVVTNTSQNHFYSVALHELAHVLGIGTAASWQAQVIQSSDGVNFEFTGAASVAANGNTNVPLSEADSTGAATPGTGHWRVGTTSTILGTSTVQEAAMDPNITTGTRKLFTTLDAAGLSDIGWGVTPIPEPSAFAFGGLLLVSGIFVQSSKRIVNFYRS